jgi:two-component system NtrC family response regulator
MVKTNRFELAAFSILVVEADPNVPRLIKRVLSTEPGSIQVTSKGAYALRIAARTRLDLVILGVKIPDLSGTDVLRRLRSIDADVPVIMIAAHGSAGTVRAAMELGAFDYLTKPLDEEEMRQVVREALASRAAVPIRLGA